MKARGRQPVRWGLVAFATFWMLVIVPLSAAAAPYAALVMDARNGEVLYSHNADTRLHPASLTKMMTLYVVFEAVENGEIGLDDKVRISANAANEPPSKLGLRAGQTIALRYLIRAAAVRSANDAATALGEAIEGSEAQFARRMNRTAQALGMTRTTFKNAHGLTQSGHLSTARDMTIMGRHLFYDYPQYYNLFSRITANAGIAQVSHTNRRMLESYRGADGIKTGYTRAAGFNLTASAERGGERIIATVFGGQSTAARNAKVAELLDLGFNKAPNRVALHRPARPPYMGKIGSGPIMIAVGQDRPELAGKTVRLAEAAAVRKSLRPQVRPMPQSAPVLVAARSDIERALRAAQGTAVASAEPEPASIPQGSTGVTPEVRPEPRPEDVVLASLPEADPTPEVVTRVSTSGGRHWGINVGRYPNEYKARQVLLQTALNEMATLDGSLRKVVRRPSGFDANFMGMTRESADLACRRLQAKKITCFMIGPS
ncbi:D-alanyl-D-alanine carboxypeptidase [Roseovarius azorensis]|uniref:D-alanyl-D-alanine carboxypeptidase n=1 Tax=Roseovarius azorensis TaxID=1287727 RepID=A0A1H7RMR0_9RHOB|nr:D-alanyl-D-alanine carboxypeptidase family protein [Roseovarius azorensis]SEL61483.1 D-alanyl-D-alanine carboxypeptidase [Roseovarius azorensis]